MKKRIILASASPRRRDLMTQIGLEFEIMVSQKEEPIPDHMSPVEICQREARVKARDVAAWAAEKYPGEKVLVIGADTVVAYGDKILGKPADVADAARMLRLLSGNVHQVYTGVSVISLPEGRENGFAERTDVEVTDLTEENIAAYLETGEPFDKAGSYGIQGWFARFVKGIQGDYNNVVGLPVGRLYREHLKEE